MTQEQPRVAIITGAAGDMGRSLCEALRDEGWRVVGADQRPFTITDVDAVDLDVCDAEAVHGLARAHPDLSLWVNAAGIVAAGSIGSADRQVWDRLIGVNLTGVFHGCEAAFTAMQTHGRGGRIVNVGSLAGQVGGTGGMHPGYGASKAGVHALTKSYARAGGRYDIACNAVAPGVLQGRMADQFPPEMLARIAQANPSRRLGCIDEVVRAIIFLGDPARSGFINGAVLPINGGVYV